jgi:hypothetical protein
VSFGFQFHLKSLEMSHARQDTCVISRSVCITCKKMNVWGASRTCLYDIKIQFQEYRTTSFDTTHPVVPYISVLF